MDWRTRTTREYTRGWDDRAAAEASEVNRALLELERWLDDQVMAGAGDAPTLLNLRDEVHRRRITRDQTPSTT